MNPSTAATLAAYRESDATVSRLYVCLLAGRYKPDPRVWPHCMTSLQHPLHPVTRRRMPLETTLLGTLPIVTVFCSAEHLTVESYTVFICQQSYLLLFGIPSLTNSFFPGLKPSNSLQILPTAALPFFYLLRGFLGLFTVISEHICFLLLVFFLFLHCLVVGSVW